MLHVQQGWPDLDARLHAEATRILGLAPEQADIRAVQVPVFHGTAMMVSAHYDISPGLAQCKERLGRRPFAYGPMTPAELKTSKAIHVMPLGVDAAGRLGLWVVADNLRGPGALNAVRIAEAVLDAGQESR
jgi:aspartate-semialdehyde dehydrogenase